MRRPEDEPLIRLLREPRGRIMRLLRQRPRTASELATELNRTTTAVRVQLANLESNGLVRRSGKRSAARKPEYLYELTPEAENLFRKAYGPLLHQLLSVMEEQMAEAELIESLNLVAMRLAETLDSKTNGDSRTDRAASAADLVEQLGGVAEVEKMDGEIVVRGWTCPFGDVSPSHPELCRMVANLLSHATGSTLEERCDRTPGSPRCAFDVKV